MGNRSSSLSSIDFQSPHTSFRSDTHTRRRQSSAPSSTTLSSCMGFQVQSSAIGIQCSPATFGRRCLAWRVSRSSSRQRFTPRLTGNRRPQTKLLLCISVVSPETGHDSSFNGCRGRSFATTLVPNIAPDHAIQSCIWSDPPSLRSYSPGEARLPAVDAQLRECDEFLQEVRDRLEEAQQHHKDCYDRKHRQLEFQVGQWV
jgi:hypothetical protein